MIDLSILKNIAKNRVKMEVSSEASLILFLQYWWSDKYKLPPNHPLFLERTLEELVIDFFMDKYMNDPNYGKAEKMKEDEEKWEEELKIKMGEDYHEDYDYLIPPTGVESKDNDLDQSEEINEENLPDKIEETF